MRKIRQDPDAFSHKFTGHEINFRGQKEYEERARSDISRRQTSLSTDYGKIRRKKNEAHLNLTLCSEYLFPILATPQEIVLRRTDIRED